jgi:hypothetical protein
MGFRFGFFNYTISHEEDNFNKLFQIPFLDKCDRFYEVNFNGMWTFVKTQIGIANAKLKAAIEGIFSSVEEWVTD